MPNGFERESCIVIPVLETRRTKEQGGPDYDNPQNCGNNGYGRKHDEAFISRGLANVDLRLLGLCQEGAARPVRVTGAQLVFFAEKDYLPDTVLEPRRVGLFSLLGGPDVPNGARWHPDEIRPTELHNWPADIQSLRGEYTPSTLPQWGHLCHLDMPDTFLCDAWVDAYEKRGAVASIGHSGKTSQSNTWNEPFNRQGLHYYFLRGLRLSDALYGNAIGVPFNVSRALGWQSSGSHSLYWKEEIWCQTTYTLIGSPAMPVWTATPRDLTLEAEFVVSGPVVTVTVTARDSLTGDPLPNAMLALHADDIDSLLFRGLTDQNGRLTATFTFSQSLPPTSAVTLTAAHNNYIPWQRSGAVNTTGGN